MNWQGLVTLSNQNEEFKSLCKALNGFFNTRQFAYYHVDVKGQAVVLNSMPAYFEHYIDQQHYLHDPHLVHPHNMAAGTALWASYDDIDYQGKNLYQVRQLFALGQGMSYVRKRQNDAFSVYSFSGDDHNQQLFNHYFNHRDLMELFIDGFEIRANHWLSEAHKSAVDVGSLKGDAFASQTGIVKTMSTHERQRFMAQCQLLH